MVFGHRRLWADFVVDVLAALCSVVSSVVGLIAAMGSCRAVGDHDIFHLGWFVRRAPITDHITVALRHAPITDHITVALGLEPLILDRRELPE